MSSLIGSCDLSMVQTYVSIYQFICRDILGGIDVERPFVGVCGDVGDERITF